MSKVVTIPKDRNPFVVFVNGVKYSYPAGATTEVPDSVADVIERYESSKPKPEPNAGNTGGTSAPADWNANEGEAGHIMHRPFYTEKVVGKVANYALGESEFDEDTGGFVYHHNFWVYTGEEYTVEWNGAEYKCTCLEMPDNDGNSVQILGNVGLLTGGESTGEPFVMLIEPHVEDPESVVYTAIIVPIEGYNGSDPIYLKITGLTRFVHEIPRYYLEAVINEMRTYAQTIVANALGQNS